MFLLLDWLLPIIVQDELLIVGLYSKVNPLLLSEVVDLILTKPSIKKSFTSHNNVTAIKSSDFTDIYFYLILQDIPKLELKISEPAEKKSKIYY